MKILIIHDIEVESERGVHRWAYANRSAALKKYAPDNWTVDRCSVGKISCQNEWDKLRRYDLVFLLDYMSAPAYRRQFLRRGITTPMVVSFNKDSRSKNELWHDVYSAADFVICNCLERFEHHGRLEKTCCISNPVDVTFWKPTVPLNERPNRVLWCGGVGSEKGKNYEEIERLKSLLEKAGYDADFRPITEICPSQVYTPEEQREWYNRGRYVVCLSISEGGGPNAVMEAMACGCVPICTAVGSVPEYLKHDYNGMICKPTAKDAMRQIDKANERHHYLACAAVASMSWWSYGYPGHIVEAYWSLFERIVKEGASSIEPYNAREEVTK